jgi:hypothetical protein
MPYIERKSKKKSASSGSHELLSPSSIWKIVDKEWNQIYESSNLVEELKKECNPNVDKELVNNLVYSFQFSNFIVLFCLVFNIE